MNLSRISNQKIFIFIITSLFLFALFLLFIDNINFVLGQDNKQCDCQPKKYIKTEKIYSSRKCKDCKCWDEGEELFRLHGTEADCDYVFVNKDEIRNKNLTASRKRAQCYMENSHSNNECKIECKDKNGNEKIECERLCNKKYPGAYFNYYYGGSGTLVNKKMVRVNGVRTRFLGFDKEGKHKIMTGFSEVASNPLTFRKNSDDLEFGGSLGTEALVLKSNKGGVYFGSHPEFRNTMTTRKVPSRNENGERIYVDKKFETEDIFSDLKGNSIEMSGKYDDFGDLIFNANYHTLITMKNSNSDIKANIKGNDSQVIIEKGLDVKQELASKNIYFQGRELLLSEPINNKIIIYYK